MGNVQVVRSGLSGIYLGNPTAGLTLETCAFEYNARFGVEAAIIDPALTNFNFKNVSFEYNRLGDYHFENPNNGYALIQSGHSFGVGHDGGSITAGAAVLATTSSNFLAGDVGAALRVPGAGAAGADLFARIQSVDSASQVTLDVNAGTTVSGVSVAQGAFLSLGTGSGANILVQDHDHFIDREIAVVVESGGVSSYTAHETGMFHNYMHAGSIVRPSGWAPLSLSNWFNAPSASQDCRYRKNLIGQVELEGHATQSSGSVIATLPAGYRPSEVMWFSSLSAYSPYDPVALRVDTDGTINHVAGATAGVSLNMVKFDPA